MKKLLLTVLTLCCALLGFSIPKYDEGRLQINGVQLLQDHADNNAYYYIPRYPRMATRADGGFEFMFMKYVGKGSGSANGGLFHTLVEFSLPSSEINQLQDSLRLMLKNNSARIIGVVPLQQVAKNGEDGLASFQVVSSILNDPSKGNSFTQSLICNGVAPFGPDSRAPIAARLTQEGATLLWESLQGKTSDVSVMVNGYYEAYVKAYNASITANVSSIYDHYSQISNYQEGFTRDQTRRITDQLVQDQVLKIEAFDRTAALGIKADEMKKLLDLVTDKLVELMFDVKSGWAKIPEREAAIEADQIKGRQDNGFFGSLFGSGNNAYISDNQYVLKRRTDIRTNTFYLNLSQATTVKVPVYTSGNLAGIYDVLKQNGGKADEYFRIVNLDDPDFQRRDISFMMDGGFAESFNDIFNFVTVSFRKRYATDKETVTNDILFTRKNFEAPNSSLFQTVNYPRLGGDAGWLDYEYRLAWNLKGSNKILRFPAGDTAWITTSDPGVTIMPPLQKRKVTVEVDRSAFDDASSSTIVVRFLTVIGGEPGVQKTLKLRAKDPSNIYDLALFHDLNEGVVYQITRHTPAGEVRGPLMELKDDFLLIGPANK